MRVALAIAVSLAMLAASTAHAQFAVSAGIEYFQWTEDTDPIEVEETGALLALGLDWTQRKEKGWLFAYRDPVNRPRHWRLELRVEGGMRLCFSDPRRFGRVRLQADPLNEPPVSELGFDVLEGLPAAVTLAELLRRRRAPIKAVLLDQSLFAGVGNWIADEALYQAGITPHRPAADLPLAQVSRLRARLHSVVRRAVSVGADSERFPRGWLFHRRWDARPPADARERIVRETIAGRTAAWVPARQK